MKRTFGRLLPASLAFLVLASFAMAPYVDAAGGGGRGGGVGLVAVARGRASTGGASGARASGGAQASGGGAAKQNVQVDNSRADTRTNNVRNTSVNNVNVERNVNVDVDAARRLLWRLGQRLPPGRHRGRGGDGRCRDLRGRRLHGAQRPVGLRAGELRGHGLPAMRWHLVRPAGIAVRRGGSTVLRGGPAELDQFRGLSGDSPAGWAANRRNDPGLRESER